MKESRSLWFASDGGYYLIPDDVTLAPGAWSLRSSTGAARSVDAEQAAPYLATSAEVSMHVKIAAERHLGGVRSALMSAVNGVGEAWRDPLSDGRAGVAAGRATGSDDIGAELDGLRGEMEEVVRSLGAVLRAVSENMAGQHAAPERERPAVVGEDMTGQGDEAGAAEPGDGATRGGGADDDRLDLN